MSIVRTLSAAVLCCTALPVLAQTAPDTRLRDQLRQTTTQLRQLEDENASLKASNNNLTQQLAQRPATPAPASKADEAKVQALRRELEQEKMRSAELQQKIDTVDPVLARWKQSYDQVAATAKTRDADAKRFESQFQRDHGALQACVVDNRTLADIADELIARYRDKGVWSAVRDKEPLTGISKISFEKLAQEYRGRVVDATVPAFDNEDRKP